MSSRWAAPFFGVGSEGRMLPMDGLESIASLVAGGRRGFVRAVRGVNFLRGDALKS